MTTTFIVVLAIAALAKAILWLERKIQNSINEKRYYQKRFEEILNRYEENKPTSVSESFDYEGEEITMARAILGIQGPYTKEQVNSVFRMVAKEFHPDKNGDREAFQEIIKARDTLLFKGNDGII